jgi:tRNA-binding protein
LQDAAVAAMLMGQPTRCEGKPMASDARPLKPQITPGKFDNVDLRAARVTAAPLAEGTRFPCRVLTLDLGPLGERVSVGQYALIEEADLVGTMVVVCVNLGSREMGAYRSEALVLGTRHPNSPEDQGQAVPLSAGSSTAPGTPIF